VSEAMTEIRIDRRSTVEQVTDGLRNNMLTGSLGPGTRLRELELSQSLGVARSTVREALLVLRNEGLVTRRSNARGWEVRRLSTDEIVDIFRARIALEMAGIAAAESAGAQVVAPVREAVDRLAEVMTTADKVAILEADFECHVALVRLTGSERLAGMYADLLLDLRLSLATVEQPSDWPRELRNHEQFVRLLERGRWDQARSTLTKRLGYVERSLLEAIATQQAAAAEAQNS
jgi:DNA-binding GntR family transcriptional regulator